MMASLTAALIVKAGYSVQEVEDDQMCQIKEEGGTKELSIGGKSFCKYKNINTNNA